MAEVVGGAIKVVVGGAVPADAEEPLKTLTDQTQNFLPMIFPPGVCFFCCAACSLPGTPAAFGIAIWYGVVYLFCTLFSLVVCAFELVMQLQILLFGKQQLKLISMLAD